MHLIIPNSIRDNASTISKVLICFDDKKIEMQKDFMHNKIVQVQDDLFDECNDVAFEVHYKDARTSVMKIANKVFAVANELDENAKIEFIDVKLMKKNQGVCKDTTANKLSILKQTTTKAQSVQDSFQIKTNKNLVYYALYDVGSDYVDLLASSIASLDESKSFNDVVVITDASTKQKIQAATAACNKNVMYCVTDAVADGIEASKAKLKIFDFANINEYENILFIDADTIAISSIDAIFEQSLQYNTLYTAYNKNLTLQHHVNNSFHSLKLMDAETFDVIKQNNQMPFNAGQFLFKNCSKMRSHFDNVNWFMQAWPGYYFFEQCFMNHYFCSNLLTDCTVLDKFVKLVPTNFNKCHDKEIILHFIGPALDAKTKKNFISKYLTF